MAHQFEDHRYRLAPPRAQDPLYDEWALLVGQRIRVLRQAAGLSLADLCACVAKPDGGSDGARYTPGYFSRIERGWPTAPLHVFIAIARALEVEPGALMGPDDIQRDVSEGEMTLVRVLRRTRTSPDEALARLSEAAPRGG